MKLSTKNRKKKTRICPRCHGKGLLEQSKYRKGRTFEYRILSWLRDNGWYARRSYGSHGIFDILATKGDRCLGIQAKNLSGTNKAYLTPKDRERLKPNLLEGKYIMEVYAGRGRTTTIKHQITDILHIYNDNGLQCRRLNPQTSEWEEYKLK